ncbi:hypothetical protein JKP88DRAFT_243211 [Tribonema minus]|uniref:Thioredoxin domain-containing protein n=1 Tax=Tribonema minus TaxID=303371 RepID=A0A835ZAU0_9STRA|nr:hypothetical protein JKP88DRAFT_243211 [Tribonema minus]
MVVFARHLSNEVKSIATAAAKAANGAMVQGPNLLNSTYWYPQAGCSHHGIALQASAPPPMATHRTSRQPSSLNYIDQGVAVSLSFPYCNALRRLQYIASPRSAVLSDAVGTVQQAQTSLPAEDREIGGHKRRRGIKGKTFEPIVIDNNKDVFIMLYTTWCPFCQALDPKVCMHDACFSARY